MEVKGAVYLISLAARQRHAMNTNLRFALSRGRRGAIVAQGERDGGHGQAGDQSASASYGN
jgi:hypothetical protein